MSAEAILCVFAFAIAATYFSVLHGQIKRANRAEEALARVEAKIKDDQKKDAKARAERISRYHDSMIEKMIRDREAGIDNTVADQEAKIDAIVALVEAKIMAALGRKAVKP